MRRIPTALFLVTLMLLCAQAQVQAQTNEEAMIERLIMVVETMPEGTKFIRNGTAHDGGRAAEHLRMKYANGKKYASTAELFIENIASRSSLSGRDYTIAFADGKTVTAREFFMEALRKIQALRNQ